MISTLVAFSSTTQYSSRSCSNLLDFAGTESADSAIGNQLFEAPNRIVCAVSGHGFSSKSRKCGRRPRHLPRIGPASSPNARAMLWVELQPSQVTQIDRKSTRLNSSHLVISY